MDRMKIFAKYLIIVIIFYLFVDLVAYIGMKNIYRDITDYKILNSSPSVEIQESKAAKTNGYIKGIVKNNTDEKIEKIYMQIDCYNDRGLHIGTKYVKIENFNSGEIKEFRINFKFAKVGRYTITFTTEDLNEKIDEEVEEIKDVVVQSFPLFLISAFICL